MTIASESHFKYVLRNTGSNTCSFHIAVIVFKSKFESFIANLTKRVQLDIIISVVAEFVLLRTLKGALKQIRSRYDTPKPKSLPNESGRGNATSCKYAPKKWRLNSRAPSVLERRISFWLILEPILVSFEQVSRIICGPKSQPIVRLAITFASSYEQLDLEFYAPRLKI